MNNGNSKHHNTERNRVCRVQEVRARSLRFIEVDYAGEYKYIILQSETPDFRGEFNPRTYNEFLMVALFDCESLDDVFEISNTGRAEDKIFRSPEFRMHSVSVGDIILEVGPTGIAKSFMVSFVGFEDVTDKVTDFYANYIEYTTTQA